MQKDKFIVKHSDSLEEPFSLLENALRFCKMLTKKGIPWELVDSSVVMS